MTKSIYQKKSELYKLWNNLKNCMNDDTISFDKYMEIREQEEKTYKQWIFYNEYTKACNKIKNSTPITSWKKQNKGIKVK